MQTITTNENKTDTNNTIEISSQIYEIVKALAVFADGLNEDEKEKLYFPVTTETRSVTSENELDKKNLKIIVKNEFEQADVSSITQYCFKNYMIGQTLESIVNKKIVKAIDPNYWTCFFDVIEVNNQKQLKFTVRGKDLEDFTGDIAFLLVEKFISNNSTKLNFKLKDRTEIINVKFEDLLMSSQKTTSNVGDRYSIKALSTQGFMGSQSSKSSEKLPDLTKLSKEESGCGCECTII